MSGVQGQIFAGLQNPVLDAQQVFRQLLDAMSQPGKIVAINVGLQPPEALNPASYAIALSMLDQDTPLKLSNSVDSTAVRDTLRFHNSILLVDAFADADFVICHESDRPDLELLNMGSEAWPNQSCTLIVQCESFYQGTSYSATGPGILHSRKIRCSTFDSTLVNQREKLVARFPMGIDLVLTCGKEFFCLPRTTVLIEESV